MKPKTKAFADTLLENPKLSQTEAYIQTHQTTNRSAAKVEASRLLTKPNVKIYMQKHVKIAKETVVDLMLEKYKPDIRLKAAQDVLDRSLGKAVQRSENQNTNLNLNIGADLTLSEDFTAFLKQKTVQTTSVEAEPMSQNVEV